MHQKSTNISIVPLQPEHPYQVQELVNIHLSCLVPGWGLPVSYIIERLQFDPGEYVVDPWVRERLTLCAISRQRVVAVAHLQRYGTEPEVGPCYQGIGDIAWFLAWPDAGEAATALLAATRRQFAAWEVTQECAWDSGLQIGPFVGIPDVWPHIADALEASGYKPKAGKEGEEAIYGGTLTAVPLPADLPLPGLTLRRTVGSFGTCFTALIEGKLVGHCDYITDLTRGGTLPALYGWGELAELEVHEDWRNRGIGTWLVRHAVAWHLLGGGERVVIAVAKEDEEAGAGRFYRRQGWEILARQRKGWKWSAESIREP